jgi:hypothetical protein
LGFLAARSEFAYDLLVQASSPLFWKQHRHWEFPIQTSANGGDFLLAGVAIQALGSSLRPEVPDMLRKLKSEESEFTHSVCGSIVSAAHRYERGAAEGTDSIMASRFDLEKALRDLRAWYVTENGKEWETWYKRMLANVGRETRNR